MIDCLYTRMEEQWSTGLLVNLRNMSMNLGLSSRTHMNTSTSNALSQATSKGDRSDTKNQRKVDYNRHYSR